MGKGTKADDDESLKRKAEEEPEKEDISDPKEAAHEESASGDAATEEPKPVESGGDPNPKAGGDAAPQEVDEEAGGKPGKIKRRKKKDPSAPKRPLSAYNLYFRDTRLALKAASDSRLSFESLVKTVSSQWKAVDADTRAKYDAAAKLDYDRYNEEMKMYRNRPEIQNSLVDPSSVKGRRKFLGVPKRPLSGYNIFFREEHARIKSARGDATEGEEGSNMTVEIAKRWSQLDVKEKSELNQRAAATQKAIETAELQREANMRDSKGPKLAGMMAMAAAGRGMPPPGYMAHAGMHPALLAHYGGEEGAFGHIPREALMGYGAPGYMGHPHPGGGPGGLEGGGDQAALAQQQAQWQHEQHMRLLMQFQHQQHQAQLMGAGGGHPGMAAGAQAVPGGAPTGGAPPSSDQQAMMAQHQAMMQWQQQQEWARQQWQQQQQYHQHQQQQQQQQQQGQPQGQPQPEPNGGAPEGQPANAQWSQQVDM